MLVAWSKVVEVEIEESTQYRQLSGLKIHMTALWNENGEQKRDICPGFLLMVILTKRGNTERGKQFWWRIINGVLELLNLKYH